MRAALTLALAVCAVATSIEASLNVDLNGAINKATVQLKGNTDTTCCSLISDALPGKVNYQTSAVSYTASKLSFFSIQEQSINPQCFVVPGSARDVSIAVAILKLGDERHVSNCQFAVKSGGHTPAAGAASIEGGVTIDLSQLNQVEIASDRKTVSVGPGNKWSNVYSRLGSAGLAMVGGRDSSVGVGGLVLGGGLSFFSGREGFACDNVRNYQLVLANGVVCNANSTNNANVFKALKGGSNNLGIVTRFDFEIFEQGQLWGGYAFQDISVRNRSFPIFEEFTKSANYDPYAAWIHSFSYSGTWASASSVIYTKPEPYPAVFKPFTDLPTLLNTYRTADLSSYTDELFALGGSRTGKRVAYATITFKNSAAFMHTMFDIFQTTITSLNAAAGELIFGSLSFQPIPTTITSKGAEKGGNILGLDKKPDLVNAFVDIAWGFSVNDDKVNDALQSLISRASMKATDSRVQDSYIYLNYGAPFQKPIGGYGLDNVAFLNRVATKVDPTGLFQRQCPGGFKLDD